jgi:hypothetical protein
LLLTAEHACHTLATMPRGAAIDESRVDRRKEGGILGRRKIATTYLQNLHLFSRDARLWLVTVAQMGVAFYGICGVLFNLHLLRLGYGCGVHRLSGRNRVARFALCGLPAGALGMRWGVRRTTMAGKSATVSSVYGRRCSLSPGLPAALRVVSSRDCSPKR